MPSASRRDVFALDEHIAIPVLPDVRASSPAAPPAGSLVLEEVQLSGRPAVARDRFGRGIEGPRPALWLVDDGPDDSVTLWRRLVDRYRATGLWPVVLTSLDDDADHRPWIAGEFQPATEADVDALRAPVVLADGWRESVVPMGPDPYVDDIRPYGATFPGLAAPLPRDGQSALLSADAVAAWGGARLGLVPCRRPADAVALVGWLGAINRCGPAELSVVLRSWEDRFGVVLCGLGFATMTLLVPHPPEGEEQALPIAAELTAVCRDVLSWDGPVDGFGYLSGGTVRGLARLLVDRPVWRLWWD